MDVEQQKAQAFVARLLSNPALQGLTALQQEEQILQFLTKNVNQLYPTLTSANFFPGKSWEDIWGFLITALFGEIDKNLLPTLKTILQERIDLSFIEFFGRHAQGGMQIKEILFTFMQKLLKKPEARRSFTGGFSALVFNFTEKYLPHVFSRKEYAHFELTKVQRLRMGKEEIQNFIHMSLFLRPVIHVFSASSVGNGFEPTPGGLIQQQYAQKVFEAVKKPLAALPDQVLKCAISSHLSFLDNKGISATARITALFANRCRNYNPRMKVDRGADYPDKSWFSIARRNYKFYGFDVKMVDAFYKTAAENGW